jgi:hypothetical protein
METAITDRPAQIQAVAIGYSRIYQRTQSRAEAHLNGEEESKTDTRKLAALDRRAAPVPPVA